MDILKLLIVFAIIIVVMALKKPLVTAVSVATVGTVLLYQIPMKTVLSAALNGITGWVTVETLLVFYAIIFLQKMMDKRKDLSNAQVALNGLFNNRRINASIVPFILGCLPAMNTVLICGPIVRDAVGDSLDVPEQAAITTFFRHISESFLPTYTTIFIALALTDGQVSVSGFVLAMLPMVVALFIAGYLVYLRRVPKDTGMVPDQPKSYYWKLLGKSIWAIGLAIALILIFKLHVETAVLICIIINFFVNKFSFKEICPFFRSAFEGRMMLSIVIFMIFKEILVSTGAVSKLPEFFSVLPIPNFLIFALIFFFGAMVAGSRGIILLCMPIAMASLNGGPALSLFVLLMCMNYAAMQISPLHICLLLCAEDFHVSFGALVKKSLPMVSVFTVLSFAYYFLLSAFGF